MINYQILSNTLVRRSPAARVLHLALDGDPGDALPDVAQSLITAVGNGAAYLELYLYTDPQAVQWSGWIAHITVDDRGKVTIDTTNDPDQRRAVFEAFH